MGEVARETSQEGRGEKEEKREEAKRVRRQEGEQDLTRLFQGYSISCFDGIILCVELHCWVKNEVYD